MSRILAVHADDMTITVQPGVARTAVNRALEGKGAGDIRTSIIDPNAEVAEGFAGDIMPGNYGDTIPKEQLDALVDYLEEQSR